MSTAHNVDPGKQLRPHPDCSDVYEYNVDYIRETVSGRVCLGCPHHGYDPTLNTRAICRANEAPNHRFKCRSETVWHGHHIYIANKLAGDL